jgi:hypothetical protein
MDGPLIILLARIRFDVKRSAEIEDQNEGTGLGTGLDGQEPLAIKLMKRIV